MDEVVGKDYSSYVDTKHRTVADYAFATKWKYILIMRLVRAQSGELKYVKEHIQQAVADILSDITTLLDIKDFSATLKKTFKENGNLQYFTTSVVPPPTKKNLSANKAGIEDKSKEEDPEKKKEYNDKFNKYKVVNKVETSFRQGIIEALSKLCNDSNGSTQIGSMQEFKDYCKQKNQFGCYFCLSLNCLTKQKASNAAKIKRVFNSKCPKK